MIKVYPIRPPRQAETPSPNGFVPPSDTCAHMWHLTRYECIDHSVQWRRQCLRCGLGSPAISKTKLTPAEMEGAKPFDHGLQRNIYDAAYTLYRETRQNAQSVRDARWWTWYTEYLQSDIWKQRRELVMQRAGGTCESCGNEHATRVHHLTYAHVGQESLFELVAVCEPCHDLLHGRDE